MGYILRNKITIHRPIVFLCGPYFQRANKSDRRKILRDYFYRTYKNGVLPLIIDDFLTEENIKDPKINIQLLEEIFAAISYKTYIFLDTLSAASELGLFMNHAFDNKVVAFVPKSSDILNKKNVGYFVKDVILCMNSEQAKYIEYRPSITRNVISTDYAVEHYGFVGDKIPDNIEQEIIRDVKFSQKEEKIIILQMGEHYPTEEHHIIYQKRNGKVFLHVSISLLFHVVMSLMYEKYQQKLVTNKLASIKDFDVEYIQRTTKQIFLNYLIKNGVVTNAEVEISTVLKFSFDEIVYHLITFCYGYHCFSTYKGIRLVDQHMVSILDNYFEIKGNNPLNVFGISDEEYNIVFCCTENPSLFYERFYIKKGGKRREFVKYSDNENGKSIRKIHDKMIFSLNGKYKSNVNSFAYKKDCSIKKCAEMHICSNAFLKYDISKFFNNIEFNILFETLERVFDIDPAYEKITKTIIKSFFFDNKLPLGLVVSPLLSDVYMLDFDAKMAKFCSEKKLIYTRYADDILISRKEIFEDNDCDAIDEILDNNLKSLNLKINSKKKSKAFLAKNGDHIKYVGVNIVHFDTGNTLTVGKQYIYDVVKEYYVFCEHASKSSLTDATKEMLFYEERRIAGKISFIKLIEGDIGWNKIKARIGNREKYFDGKRLRFDVVS